MTTSTTAGFSATTQSTLDAKNRELRSLKSQVRDQRRVNGEAPEGEPNKASDIPKAIASPVAGKPRSRSKTGYGERQFSLVTNKEVASAGGVA
ncbi:MAG: hypothetical protein AAGI54_02505 [Planctomycetota bacterium]